MGKVEYVTQTQYMRNACEILAGKAEEKRTRNILEQK
jgi:hypothetical protein